MAEENETQGQQVPDSGPDSGAEQPVLVERGPVSQFLMDNGFDHQYLDRDAAGVELLEVPREFLLPLCTALYAYGFNYLQCQCGYDLGPGQPLVSLYHLIKLSDGADHPQEVRVQVKLPRQEPRLPSVYWIWKSADWQERETYDMYGIVFEGHPNLKRILMPEDWVGWPLRKDYITPDFYELQDAY